MQRLLDNLDCVSSAMDRVGYPIPYLGHSILASSEGLRFVENEARRRTASRSRPNRLVEFAVAKPTRDETRYLQRLPLVDGLEYHSMAKTLAVRASVLEHENCWSFKGNRSSTGDLWQDNPRGRLGRWLDFQDSVLGNCGRWGFCGTADVATFFDCIVHQTLVDTVHRLFAEQFTGRTDDLNDICLGLKSFLSSWGNSDSGIPQGPLASYFFADVYLLPSDYLGIRRSFTYDRFVDDYRIYGNTTGIVGHQIELIEAWHESMGLKLNQSKGGTFTSGEIAEDITRVTRLKDAIESFSRLNPPWTTIEHTLDLLVDELHRSEPQRYYVKFCLGVLRRNIRIAKYIKRRVLEKLLSAYQLHLAQSAVAPTKWQSVLNAGVELAEIQELLVEVLDDDQLLDTDRAYIVGGLSTASSIQSRAVRSRLRKMVEYDATLHVEDDEWTGSVASRIGKGLFAAVRHGNGREVLMDLYRDNNPFSECRRYTAAVTAHLTHRDRKEFLGAQLRECHCGEERLVAEFYLAGGRTPSPDSVPRPLAPSYF